MNSRNKIILGCLSLLVIASVGYALFSEKITINGVAKVKKDNLDVSITQCKRYGVNLTEEEIKAFGWGDRYKPGDSMPGLEKAGEGTCEILENGTIKTTSKLNKPGDLVSYSVFIKNNGNKPIKIKEVNSDNNRDSSSDRFGGKIGDEQYWNKHDIGAVYYMAEIDINGHNKYPNPEMSSYNPRSDSSIENAGIILNKNEKVYLQINHQWYMDRSYHSMSEVEKAFPKDGVKIDYNVQLVFEQVAQ